MGTAQSNNVEVDLEVDGADCEKPLAGLRTSLAQRDDDLDRMVEKCMGSTRTRREMRIRMLGSDKTRNKGRVVALKSLKGKRDSDTLSGLT